MSSIGWSNSMKRQQADQFLAPSQLGNSSILPIASRYTLFLTIGILLEIISAGA
jgi:hypothetical protein